MSNLRGKKAVVTGAANGIGRAIALALAREGVSLYLLDIDETRLAEVVARGRQHGVEVVGARCDLTDGAQISAELQAMRQQWSRVDLLVNNAGVCYQGPTEQMTASQWQRLLQINLLAPLQFVHELLPTFLEQNAGHIVNICSFAGLFAVSRMSAYSASKFGLVGFSAALRAEYGKRGIGVTAICPGFVQTDLLHTLMRAENAQPLRLPPAWTCVSPETIATETVRAIRENRGMVVVPIWARLAWRLHRLAPGLLPALGRARSWLRNCVKSLKTKHDDSSISRREAA